MTTLLTTCITNLNQKLKKPERKNLTQLDAHGPSDQCCHYIKMKLRFYHHAAPCISRLNFNGLRTAPVVFKVYTVVPCSSMHL